MKKQQNLMAEATAWALEQSESAAKTEKGIARAVEKWLNGRDLTATYIDALQEIASRIMADDIKHRAQVTVERKSIRKIPIYARYRFSQTPEVQKTYASRAGTENIPDYIDDVIRDLAFDTIFSRSEYSRYRKIYAGQNRRSAGLRTETNGKFGWDEVVWHYADFSATLSPDKRKIYVDFGVGFKEYQILTSGSCRIGRTNILRPEEKSGIVLKPHHLCRLYASAIRGHGIVWRWNLKEKAGEYIHIASGESFHTPGFTRKPKEVFHEAVIAFRKRRDEKKRKQEELKSLENIYVTASASIEAGNCKVKTEEFNHELDKKYGMHIFAMSAAALLVMRDDDYTRRAVRYAAQK